MTRPLGRTLAAVAGLAVALGLAACGGGEVGTTGSGTFTFAGSPAPGGAPSWEAVLAQAKGQTVSWAMYGGDDTLNAFVTGRVADRLKTYGVTLNQVKLTDTADAINTVLGERQAGRTTTGGSIDAIWVNGENFATGRQAGLWSCGWPSTLPNARYVDLNSPAVSTDFGVPVDDCEAAWQQANSALVYDSSKLSASDVASVSSLFAWSAAHPGRFTYAAPPDFTGSMAVRTVLYSLTGGAPTLPTTFDESAYDAATADLWPTLASAGTSFWRGGSTYPQDQDAVEKLYASGEISAFFTYGPGAVGDMVGKGVYPSTTREAVVSSGNIANTSFIGVPANAEHHAAALVLANVLQDPETQLALYQAEGAYPGIDVAKTSVETQAAFAAVPVSPSALALSALTAHAQPELGAAYVTRLEKDWKAKVLQR